MAKNKVILTGFMGCGKTTIGRILAEKRGQELLDTDHYIEQKQGRSISDIFATQGEEVFRDMETEALRELIQKQEPMVIALGGGLPIGGNLYGEEPVRQRALLRGERTGTVSRIRICVLSENHTRGGLPAVKGRYDKASFTDGGSLYKDHRAFAAA